MEQDKRVATTSTGTFLDIAIQNLEDMKVAAQLILDSKLAPDHFYEKDANGKTDYTKGNVASVILVCAHGHDLGLKPLVALQHVIPVNGLLSIKGDAAKTLIFKSGKLEPGSWKESQTGSLTDGTLEISITAKRIDTKETMTRTFGVVHAKRAGLWVDESKIRGSEGWKWQKSAWYKYPERMITYRALGFLARDLFPDVLSGSYTTEEAMDAPTDTTVVIPTKDGVDIVIPDKDFSQNRSETLTRKASDFIDKRNHVENKPAEVASRPMTPEESYPAQEEPTKQRGQCKTMLNGTEGAIPVYTENELMEMGSDELMDLVMQDGIMQKVVEVWDQKNTNKKLRTIILAKYAGEAISMLAQYDPEYGTEGPPAKKEEKPDEPSENEMLEQATYEAGVEAEVDPNDPSTWPTDDGDVQPNEAFDVSAPDPEPQVQGNKFDIGIPELVDGKRAFDQVKPLFEELSNKAGVDNNAYDSLVKTKFPQFQKYRTKEDFCYMGEVSEINALLNSI